MRPMKKMELAVWSVPASLLMAVCCCCRLAMPHSALRLFVAMANNFALKLLNRLILSRC